MNILFLDLEDTIIEPVKDDWANTCLINVSKIKEFMEKNIISDLRIFSFAIWDEKQKKQFEFWVKPAIERVLEQKLNQVPTIDDHIMPACCKQKGLSVQLTGFSDMVEFWGKDISFMLCMKEWFKNNKDKIEIFFLDDDVDNMTFEIKDNNIKCHILNINKI